MTLLVLAVSIVVGTSACLMCLSLAVKVDVLDYDEAMSELHRRGY